MDRTNSNLTIREKVNEIILERSKVIEDIKKVILKLETIKRDYDVIIEEEIKIIKRNLKYDEVINEIKTLNDKINEPLNLPCKHLARETLYSYDCTGKCKHRPCRTYYKKFKCKVCLYEFEEVNDFGY